MSRKNRKPASTFFRSENAVATAVAAALLLGIIIAFLTNVQVNYVPEWKEDAEYEHMSEVWEDMARLKSNADILSAGLQINPGSSISLSSPIRMGGGELPVVGRMKAGGTLTINTLGGRMEVNVSSDNSSLIPVLYQYDCGSITYHSSNTEYIDQTFCYENGALIVSQNDRSLMKLSPLISLERLPSSYLNFSLTAISLEGSSGVLSSNAVEEIKMTSEGLEGDSYITEPLASRNYSVSMAIFTENPEAWETYLENSVENANLQAGDYNLTSNSSAVLFELHPSGEALNVDIHKAIIKVETGIQ